MEDGVFRAYKAWDRLDDAIRALRAAENTTSRVSWTTREALLEVAVQADALADLIVDIRKEQGQ